MTAPTPGQSEAAGKQFLDAILSLTDASNWGDLKPAAFYRGYHDAMTAVHETVLEYQMAVYAEAKRIAALSASAAPGVRDRMSVCGKCFWDGKTVELKSADCCPQCGSWYAHVIDRPATLAPGMASVPGFTYGHCEYHKMSGGCPHHNLQCGYPECDRRPLPGDTSALASQGSKP